MAPAEKLILHQEAMELVEPGKVCFCLTWSDAPLASVASAVLAATIGLIAGALWPSTTKCILSTMRYA
jgi:hypothetical protein